MKTKKERNHNQKPFILLSLLIVVCLTVAGIFFFKTIASQNSPKTNTEADYTTKNDVIGIMENQENYDLFYENAGFYFLSGTLTDVKVIDESSALEVVNAMSEQLNINLAKDSFNVMDKTNTDSMVAYRFQQEYLGLEVYGKSIVVTADGEGNVIGISGNNIVIEDISVEPALTEDDVTQLIKESIAGEMDDGSYTISTPRLILYTSGIDVEDVLLAYEVSVSGIMYISPIFVNANTGEIISAGTLINTLQEEVELEGQTEVRKITVENTGEGYVLVNHEYGMIAYHADENNGRFWRNGESQKVKIPQSRKGDGTQKSAVDAMKNVINVEDFYKEVLSRDSYDGNGGSLDIYVDVRWLEYDVFEDYQFVPKKIDMIDNAFSWRDGEGDEIIVFTKRLGDKYQYSNEIDVVGHELTHTLVRYTTGLRQDIMEPHALDEAIADVMGYCIEAYYSEDREIDWENSVRSAANPKYKYYSKSAMVGIDGNDDAHYNPDFDS